MKTADPHSKKAFREFLNAEDSETAGPLHKHGRYQQRKRLYGDYLYFQDREKFDADYEDWLKAESVKENQP